MEKIKSKYKLTTILGITALIAISLVMISLSVTAFYDKYLSGKENIIFPFVILTSLFLIILLTSFLTLKEIAISNESIKYRYSLFPLLTTKIDKKDIDGYVIVLEKRNSIVGSADFPVFANFSAKEAIWIIKNGKLKLRLSSLYYKNFATLKDDITTLKELDVKIESSFDQFLYRIRMNKISNTN